MPVPERAGRDAGKGARIAGGFDAALRAESPASVDCGPSRAAQGRAASLPAPPNGAANFRSIGRSLPVSGRVGHDDLRAPRMDEAAAEKLIEALNLRIEKRIPLAGNQQAPGRAILAAASGKPDHERMSPELAAATREQLPDIERRLERLGPLVSSKFTGVDPWGWDIYEAQFAHGRDGWRIDLGTDGRVDGIFSNSTD